MWALQFLITFVCALSVLSNELVDVVIDESEIDKSLSENIVVYGIISELASHQSNISSICNTELVNIFRSINNKEMWAIKVMDASGTYRSSFVWGQNAWIGSKRNCDFLNKAPKFTVSPDVPKLMDAHLIPTISRMEMEFKMIFLNVVSPYKIDPIINLRTAFAHRLGLCLPKSCSNQDIELLSKSFFAQKKLKFQTMYNATIDIVNVRNMNIENFTQRSDVIGISFAIGIVTGLVILFSVANYFVQNTKLDELKRFLKCFSIYDNVASIYNTSSSPKNINSINGLRTLVCFWVLLSHCGYFNMYAYDNLPEFMAGIERVELLPFFAIVFYVDSFFVLSGLLLVYNFLKDERTIAEVKHNSIVANLKLFLKKVIHRYIRLTPAFIFSLGIGHLVSVYLKESSSLYVDETFDAYCTTDAFWNSVFYIHNLFEVKDMCTAWSWYIACDMQFYIAILFVLFVYARNPAIAKMIFVTLLAAMTAGGIYSNVELNVLPRLDSIFNNLDEFYIEPWNRMHPYLAGCTVGYIMFLIKDKQFPENRFVTITYWIVTSCIFTGTLFISAFKDATAINFALALSFGRYFLGIFVGQVVVMCHLGYGGIVNSFLSSRLFVHMNKVTYCMYLIHPILILYFNSTQESSAHFDLPSLTVTIFGIASLTYVTSVAIVPIMEIPFQKLSDEYVIKKSKAKK